MIEEVPVHWISGFWRRIGALFVDLLVLGVFGFILGVAFESKFVELGGWGRLIGFAIALGYFGVMNSKISGGQTIGKKALKLRVVNSTNELIGWPRSSVRYCILGIPFFLNGAHFTNEAMFSYLIYPLSLLIFGGIFSIVYLYIFNRITRQSLHDLAVGTFVVNTDVGIHETGAVWKPHLAVVTILFMAAGIAPAIVSQLAQSEPFNDLLTAQVALMNNPSVSYATISDGSTTFSSVNDGTTTNTYVSAQIFLTEDAVNDDELARQLAEIVVVNYPELINRNALNINLTYGYDIGISSKWSSHVYRFNPDEL